MSPNYPKWGVSSGLSLESQLPSAAQHQRHKQVRRAERLVGEAFGKRLPCFIRFQQGWLEKFWFI